MSLQIKSRYPGLSVILLKNVGRQRLAGSGANALPVSTRFSGQRSILDVTQYIGEHGAVHVQKSVRQPAGFFSIEFTDQLIPSADDDLYGLFEPQDVVEIRMAANAYQYTSASSSTSPLPIMMRGFISSVRRIQSMGSDGKPVRKVVISGYDYGKIWQICQIFYNPWLPDAANYISQFKLFTRYGVAFEMMTAGALVAAIFGKVVNPFIVAMGASEASAAAIAAANAVADQISSNPLSLVTSGAKTNAWVSPISPIKLDIQLQDGKVAPFGVNDWQGGSIYELLKSFCDIGCWNELFIEDRSDGPYVVFRPNPFLTAGGEASVSSAYINGNVVLPAVTDIDSSYVISMDLGRSDQNVANFYWVEAPQYDMNYQFVGQAMAATGGPATTFYIGDTYPNSSAALYGIKQMREVTNEFSLEAKYAGGTEAPQIQQDASASTNWIGQRRAALIAQNKDNVVFEEGTLKLVGAETIKAGTYIRLTHGNMRSLYYVVAAEHSYAPFGAYITSATVERGTGFIDRAQKGGGADSPYFAELADAQTATSFP